MPLFASLYTRLSYSSLAKPQNEYTQGIAPSTPSSRYETISENKDPMTLPLPLHSQLCYSSIFMGSNSKQSWETIFQRNPPLNCQIKTCSWAYYQKKHKSSRTKLLQTFLIAFHKPCPNASPASLEHHLLSTSPNLPLIIHLQRQNVYKANILNGSLWTKHPMLWIFSVSVKSTLQMVSVVYRSD